MIFSQLLVIHSLKLHYIDRYYRQTIQDLRKMVWYKCGVTQATMMFSQLPTCTLSLELHFVVGYKKHLRTIFWSRCEVTLTTLMFTQLCLE